MFAPSVYWFGDWLGAVYATSHCRNQCWLSSVTSYGFTRPTQWTTRHCSDVIMAQWRLKSPGSRLFTQPFIQAQIKENIKAPAFVWGIYRCPVNSPHKWPVTRKMFPFDDIIMDHASIQSATNLIYHGSVNALSKPRPSTLPEWYHWNKKQHKNSVSSLCNHLKFSWIFRSAMLISFPRLILWRSPLFYLPY